jgi:hypothetical protein
LETRPLWPARHPAITEHWWVAALLKTFDRNSDVRFDQGMAAIRMQKSLVHGLAHSQLFNHSYAFMRVPVTMLVFGLVLGGMVAKAEDGWRKIENPSFSFSLPSAFNKTEARGIDSFVEEYAADGIELSFDYGIYSNNFGGWPKDTKFEASEVDGKAARIGTTVHEFHKGFPYSTQIYIKLKGTGALSMFAACKSQKEVALARKIFETIAFKK